MLSKLLSHETCAECRICCGFVDSDKWEIPIFAGEEESAVAEGTAPVRQIPGTKSCVFDMKFHGSEVIMCPAASDHGCTLGDKRPFDCMIWAVPGELHQRNARDHHFPGLSGSDQASAGGTVQVRELRRICGKAVPARDGIPGNREAL